MLTLVIPSLRFAAQPGQMAFDPSADLDLPGLTALLGRGEQCVSAPASTEQWLRQAFNAQDVSAAALTLALDLPDAEAGHWLRADPVHLRADRDRALLFDASVLNLRMDEAQALVDALNGLYRADGYSFVAATPSRWYLRLPMAMDGQTTPLAEALGRDIRPCMPRGENAMAWHRLLNEIQMLLYTQPVNDVREQAGQLAANSVWLWGEGQPLRALAKPAAQLYAEDALARGLAQAAGIAHGDLPDGFQHLPLPDSLLLLDSLVAPLNRGDIHAWRAALQMLEQGFLLPLWQAWRQGRVDDLCLVLPGEDRTVQITLSAGQRWKFWRKPRLLKQL